MLEHVTLPAGLNKTGMLFADLPETNYADPVGATTKVKTSA